MTRIGNSNEWNALREDIRSLLDGMIFVKRQSLPVTGGGTFSLPTAFAFLWQKQIGATIIITV